MTVSLETDLHDSVLNSLEFSCCDGRMLINLDVYAEPNASVRSNVKIEFIDVSRFVVTSNLGDLQLNKSAGNVNYWAPAESGTTYIYLINGFLEIDSKSITITEV